LAGQLKAPVTTARMPLAEKFPWHGANKALRGPPRSRGVRFCRSTGAVASPHGDRAGSSASKARRLPIFSPTHAGPHHERRREQPIAVATTGLLALEAALADPRPAVRGQCHPSRRGQSTCPRYGGDNAVSAGVLGQDRGTDAPNVIKASIEGGRHLLKAPVA